MWQRLFFVLLTAPLMSDVSLDQMMSYQQMRETGVSNLSYTQKKALENWIDAHYAPKQGVQVADQQLYLSLNIEMGTKLELSDGSTYEIFPDDRLFTAYWITPIPIQLSKSSNPDYPVKITNLTTGTSVSAKPITLKEALETPQGPSTQPPNGTNIIQPPQPPPSQPITPQPQGATGQ